MPFARPFLFWLAALLLLLFLTLHPSALLWRLTGLDALPLHPWHLLALDGLPLAFLAGSMVRLDRRLAQPAAWAGLLALVILASYPYLAPRFLQVDPGLQPLALLQPRGAASPQIMVLAAETSEQAVPPAEITPTLTLTLTWQALAPVEADYTVFVHLLAPDGQKVAQRDVQPCNGDCPTSAWEPGDVVVDRYALELPVPEPAAPYRLAVGLYLLATGDRVPVAGRDAESRWRSGDGAFYLEVP